MPRAGVTPSLAKAFKEQGALSNEPCWICNQPIDYTLTKVSKEIHSLDHFYPVSQRPDLENEPANFRHSHMGCNASRGNTGKRSNVAINSRDWLG